MKKELPLISASMRSAWKSCQRKVFFRYVAGIEVAKPANSAREIGSAFHTGLDLWRSGSNARHAADEATRGLISSLLRLEIPDAKIAEESAKLRAYLIGYFQVFAGDKDLKGGDSERQVKYENEIGYIDCTYKDAQGETWIIEDKTTSDFSDYLKTALPMNEQLLTYVFFLRKAGHKVGGIRFRQTLKSRHSVNKKETLEEFELRMRDLYTTLDEFGANKYYREIVVKIDEEDALLFERERESVNREITLALATRSEFTGFRYNSNECIGKFGPCDFLKACSNRKNLKACSSDYRTNGKVPLDDHLFRREIFGLNYLTVYKGEKESEREAEAERTGAGDWWEV